MTNTRDKIDAAVEQFASDIRGIMQTWIENLIVNGLDSAAARRAPAKKVGRPQDSGRRRGRPPGSKNKKVAKKTKPSKAGAKKAPVKRSPRGPRRLEKAGAPPGLDPSDMPAYVKTVRKRMGLSQAELAKRAGVQRGLIAHIEQGKLAPNAKVLDALQEG